MYACVNTINYLVSFEILPWVCCKRLSFSLFTDGKNPPRIWIIFITRIHPPQIGGDWHPGWGVEPQSHWIVLVIGGRDYITPLESHTYMYVYIFTWYISVLYSHLGDHNILLPTTFYVQNVSCHNIRPWEVADIAQSSPANPKRLSLNTKHFRYGWWQPEIR